MSNEIKGFWNETIIERDERKGRVEFGYTSNKCHLPWSARLLRDVIDDDEEEED